MGPAPRHGEQQKQQAYASQFGTTLAVSNFFVALSSFLGSWGRSISIVTTLRTERPGFDSRKWQWFFSLRHRVQNTQFPVQRVAGALTPRTKRQVREADHSPPSRIRGAIPPLPIFTVCNLVNLRDNFTFIKYFLSVMLNVWMHLWMTGCIDVKMRDRTYVCLHLLLNLHFCLTAVSSVSTSIAQTHLMPICTHANRHM
jgi:hypothetical protein